MKQCAYCLTEIDNFLPFNGGMVNVPSNLVLLDGVGWDFDHYGCPKCGSNGIERHLRLYCDVLNIFQDKDHLRILHFAPEPRFSAYLALFKPELHILADFQPKDNRFQQIDISSIPYSDNSFDFVIANHVLEHVLNPKLTLSEINRVLKPAGMAILQTPFSAVLSETFEDPGLNTPELRTLFYGHEDHLRLFGKNVFEIFTSYLDSRVRNHSDVFNKSVAEKFGVNSREPFFLFSKKNPIVPEVTIVKPKLKQRGKPVVSIHCITYNHEDFISDTLEGFLSQQTDFPYEIVIGEDYSTDNTLDIIRKYQDKYPDFIKLVRGNKNLGPHKNGFNTLISCTGEFVAFCEGDDYWTDPAKLQKQVDFLRLNNNYVLTYGSVCSHTPAGIDYNYIGGTRKSISQNELLRAPPLNTLTTLFRNVIQPLPVEYFTTGAGDMFIWSLLGHHGAGMFMPEILPSIYRQHLKGAHSSKSSAEKITMSLMSMYSLFLYYRRTGNIELMNFFATRSCYEATQVLRLSEVSGSDNPIFSLVDRMCMQAESVFEFDRSALEKIINIAQSQI